MSATKPNRTPPLREALYTLSMAKRVPDAQVLDEVVRLYPQFAEELTEFAVELVVDSLREPAIGEVEAEIDLQVIDADVSRAISKFHNRVYALRQDAEKRREEHKDASDSIRNPFANLARPAFREVARRLYANTALVAKLRDRQIRFDTMSDGFKSLVADVLGKVSNTPPEVVDEHLAAARGPDGTIRQFYKAKSTQDTSEPQSFEEAVKTSGLSQEQQVKLLSL